LIVTSDWLLQSARAEAEKYFEPDSLICIIPRETAWYAITLLESDCESDHVLANRILENLIVKDGTHSPCTLFVIYQRYRHLLSDKAQNHILSNLERNLPISALVRYSDGNVNHPLAAYVNLVCSGELLNDQTSSILGRNLLKNFQQIISSRVHKNFQQAEMAEYNSPTYTALDLWFLAMGNEFAQDEEFRSLAQYLEERLWINIAMHWHESTQQFAGPFSRAYAEDSLGGFSALHCTFGFAFQKEIYLNSDLPVKFNHPSALIENAFIAILNFHVPVQAKNIAFHKPLPYYFRMTSYCEQYHENARSAKNISTFDPEIYPGGWSDLTSYLDEEFCLGTASRPYINGGQNDTFMLRYRRSNQINDLKDFRSLVTRMVFNDSCFGQDNFCHVTGFPITKDYLYEEGRPFLFQHKNKAIIGYVPKRVGHAGVSELRLDLIFSYHAPFDCFSVDDEEISFFPFQKKDFKKILLSDYKIYLAIFSIHPSLLSDFQGKISISQIDDFLIISIYNYQGKTQDFSKEMMSQAINGFVCLVESKQNFPNFQDFKEYVDSARVSRQVQKYYIHKIAFQVNDEKMIFRFDPLSERIIERTLNGKDQTVYHFEIEAQDGADEVFLLNDLYSLDNKKFLWNVDNAQEMDSTSKVESISQPRKNLF